MNVFKVASGLDEKSQEAQVNTLIYTMGENADEIFQSFEMSADDKKDYKKVKERFDSHFIPRKNVVYELFSINANKKAKRSTCS